MAIFKTGDLDELLRNRSSEIGVVLIYGEDPGSVRDWAAKAVQSIAGSEVDPFNVVLLNEAAIAGDPARIVDEVMSLPFFGGSRVIWFRGADQNFLKFIEPVLSGSVKGNLVVAEAGGLAKSSALRTRLERSDRAAVLPLYEAGAEAAIGAIAKYLKAEGLKITTEGSEFLVDLVGRGGATIQREIEKLAIYCHGGSTVSLKDVEAICGSGSWADLDNLADAVFGGELSDVDQFYMQLIASGVDPGRILSAMHSYVLRLVDQRQSLDQGHRIEQVLKMARPPIFFKRKATVQHQLTTLTTDFFMSAASSLSAAIEQSRLISGMAENLTSRTLLSVARSSNAVRQRMN